MISFETAKDLFEREQLPLTPMQFEQLTTYLELLVEVNQQMNLTAITDPYEIWCKHFLDSAVIGRMVSMATGSFCVDVGTGAGFPGMVLAILRPDLKITLLDSLQKRIFFLTDVAEKLQLDHVRCVHARAEDGAKLPEYREQFDYAVARAVAPIPVLAEYCLPFVRVGGVFLAMKGPAEDVAGAEKTFAALGGTLEQNISYALQDVGERKLLLVRKTSSTDPCYPRRGDKIKKRPL